MEWQPDNPCKVAAAYSILKFQQMPDSMPTSSYIWDINSPNEPEVVLKPSSPIVSLSFNYKNPVELVAGLYNGLVC